MLFEVFRKFIVLFFCYPLLAFGQTTDSEITIELGSTNFPIERPFTISVIVSNSESRPRILFPELPGFVKKGVSASVTRGEIAEKIITNQVIIQNYQALTPGRFRVLPFTIPVNGQIVRSEGALLTVLPSTTVPASVTPVSIAPPPQGAAFLQLQTSKTTIYAGEAVALTLSFFVINNYPYELSFTTLDKQLQYITKKIRPVNAWEENMNITELKPIPVTIQGKKFREYRLYQAVFFPLGSRLLQLPAVSLQLERPRPVIGPPSSQAETILFTSRPVTIAVRALPVHPLRGQVPVGSFRLEENLERLRISAGQSTRYTFGVVGEGNIATLPTPVSLNETPDVTIFPPEERQTINRLGNRVVGWKNFTFFIVPRQNGPLRLENHFQWIYFDPQRARYDTLRPKQTIQVGGKNSVIAVRTSDSVTTSNGSVESSTGRGSIYAGIEALQSTRQPINGADVIRAVANVLIVVMLLGMIVVFFRK